MTERGGESLSPTQALLDGINSQSIFPIVPKEGTTVGGDPGLLRRPSEQLARGDASSFHNYWSFRGRAAPRDEKLSSEEKFQ